GIEYRPDSRRLHQRLGRYLEVSDEVAAALKADKLYEAAYQRKVMRNKAQYSLDCDDGIEYSACQHEPSPQELLERKELFYHLWNALNSLPEVQGVRVEAHLILGKSYTRIAKEQGADRSAVRRSVKRGKTAMKKYLKKVL
uniref:sigma factor-like helix-turn-helix DNA-binding protein n=1 Tax=Adlercreutzia equolifaciens TaxID=446660 RepID=UPI003F8D716A